MHDVDSKYKGSAKFAVVCSYTSHMRIDDNGDDEDEDNGEEKTSPAKITAVTEDRAVVRIGETRRMLFCDLKALAALEEIVPFSGTVTFRGRYLLNFEPDGDDDKAFQPEDDKDDKPEGDKDDEWKSWWHDIVTW